MSGLSRILQSGWLSLARPRAWLLFLLAYTVVHMGVRLLLSDTLQLDDAEQLIQSQSLRLNYGNFQPPFYTWVLWGIWQFTEPQLWILYLLRYLILFLAFWLWHRVSRLLFDEPRWVVASATSWLLIGQLGWNLHQGSTHTTLLTLALIMSLHAIVRVLRHAAMRDYLYLGLAVGLGMLAKYSYAGFLLPMLLAALAAPETRARLLRWPLLWALLAALLVMLPALSSLFLPEAPVSERLQGETAYRIGGLLAGDFSLPWQWLLAAAGFLAPLWLIYAAIFRTPLLSTAHASAQGVPEAGGRAVIRALLDRFHGLMLLGVLIASLFLGIEHLKIRWLHPFLMLVPFWWLLHAHRLPQRAWCWSALQWVTLTMLLLVLLARLWQVTLTPHVGKKPSRVTWPVMQAIALVPEPVWRARRLKATDTFLAAHLRLKTGREIEVVTDLRRPGPGEALFQGSNREDVPDVFARWRGVPGLKTGTVVARRGKAGYRVDWVAGVGNPP